MMCEYDERVRRTMSAMGTAPQEWAACPVEMKTDKEGHVCPSTTFPQGYTPAPSPIPEATSNACQCRLCGHPIKNCYWLQCDTRQWLLMVGSECVTHFAAASGEKLAKDSELHRAARLRDALDSVIEQWQAIPHQIYRFVTGARGSGKLEKPGALRTWYRSRDWSKFASDIMEWPAKYGHRGWDKPEHYARVANAIRSVLA